MDAGVAILVGLLAEIDVYHFPNRRWPRGLGGLLYERQRRYAMRGLVWSSGKVSEADRKASQRDLESLIGAGLVRPAKSHSGRTHYVRLTDLGDRAARSMVGLPDTIDALEVLAEIGTILPTLERSESQRQYFGDMVPEIALARCMWGDEGSWEKLVAVEERIVPAIVRGWAAARASVDGRVWYFVEPAGHDALADSEKHAPAIKLPEFDLTAAEHYHEELKRRWDELPSLTADNPNELGWLPLSCGMGF